MNKPIRSPRLPLLRAIHHPNSSGITRRQFLKGSAIAASIMAISPLRLFSMAAQPRIAIIGAGMAGLNAAYTLKKAGISSTIYEASARSGGRMLSVKDVMAPGLTTEFGGEFIDSGHLDIIDLVNEFKLQFLDRQSPENSGLSDRAYFFNDRFYSSKEVIEAYEPFRKQMGVDALLLGREITYDHPAEAEKLDNTSISEYLRALQMPKWLSDLLNSAYRAEFGLDTTDQSALNLLSLFPTPVGDKFELFGESDERFKVFGGNQQITNELEKRVYMDIEFGAKLASIKQKGSGFSLKFIKKGNPVKIVEADILLLAIPFSVLRHIPMEVDLPKWKENAISKLGYGTCTKVMIGVSDRIWRKQGYVGEIVSDEDFGLAWDNSELQPGTEGGMTVYTGGAVGKKATKGTVKAQSEHYSKYLEKVYPGFSNSRNGKIARMDWSGNTFSQGCYAAYKKGQWTTIRGSEAAPVGNLFFAGEHCSLEFQGYMNGAAESGRVAAEQIAKTLRE